MTSKYLQKFQSNSLEMFPRINEQNHDRGGQLTEDHLEEEMMLNMGEEKAIKRNSSYSMWRLLDNSDNCPDPGSDSLSIDSKNESCVSAKRAKLDETSSDSSDLQNGDTMSQENLIGANTTPADVNAESVNNLMAIIKNILATSQKKEEPFKNGPSQLDALKNVLSGIINKKTCNEEQPKLNPAAEVKSDTISQQQTPQATAFQHDLLFGPSMKANLLPNPYTFFSTLLAKTSQNSCGNLFSQNFLNPNVLNPLNRKLSQSSMTNTSPPSLHRSNMANLKHTAHSNSIIESFSNSLFFNPSGNNGTKDLFRTNFPNKSLFGKLTTHEEIHHRMNQTPAVRDTNSLLASAQLAAACNSDNFGYTCTLTPVHLRKAKLMFFYVRYPNSSLLKIYFPDVRFNKNNTAQLVKWFSNFREFYYIQMEKFARLAITEGVQSVDEISITVESELYRSLNLHYNRNQQIEVPDQFLHVVEATLKEFYLALSTGKDNEQSWKKPIYKIIARLDQPVPEFFKSPNWINQLTDG